MALPYGTDTFTVSTDQALSTYNSNWTALLGTIPNVIAAADNINAAVTAQDEIFYYNDGEAAATHRRIFANVRGTSDSGYSYPGIALRASGTTAYVITGSIADNQWFLYHVSSGSFTQLTTWTGTFVVNTTYAVEAYTDDNAGSPRVWFRIDGGTWQSYTVTNASYQLTSGFAGGYLYITNGVPTTYVWIDDIRIEAADGGGGTELIGNTIIQFRGV